MANHLYCRCGAVYDFAKLESEKLYKCKECESILSPVDAIETEEFELLQRNAIPKSGVVISLVLIIALALLGFAIAVSKINAKAEKVQETYMGKLKDIEPQLKQWEKTASSIVIEDKSDEKSAQYMGEVFKKITEARRKVYPAVVRIFCTTNGGQGGTGSGCIIEPDVNGTDNDVYIVSNFHVVQDAYLLDVTLSNQETALADLVYADDFCDVAIIKLRDPSKIGKIKRVNFGDSDKIEVGDYCMTMGAPQGLGRSLAFGIIATREKFIPTSLGSHISHMEHEFFQIGAAINHGNSGGPLVSLKGEIIGMNTLGIIEVQRLGYAICSNYEKEIANEIIRNEKSNSSASVERSTYGMTFQYTDMIGMENHPGVLVGSVETDSPAYGIGIRPGDIITKVDGKEVSCKFYNDLSKTYYLFQKKKVGTSMDVTWMNMVTGEEKSGTMISRGLAPEIRDVVNGAKGYCGIQVSPAYSSSFEAFGHDQIGEGGFQIDAWAEPLSAVSGPYLFDFKLLGFQRGDIIHRVDGRIPKTIIQMINIVYDKVVARRSTDPVVFTVIRGGNILYLPVNP